MSSIAFAEIINAIIPGAFAGLPHDQVVSIVKKYSDETFGLKTQWRKWARENHVKINLALEGLIIPLDIRSKSTVMALKLLSGFLGITVIACREGKRARVSGDPSMSVLWWYPLIEDQGARFKFQKEAIDDTILNLCAKNTGWFTY